MSNPIAFCERSQSLEDLLTQRPLVVLNFTAEWSGPCACIKREVDRLAAAYSQQLTVVEIDIDRNPNTVREMGIASLPTVSIVWLQERVEQFVGLHACEDFEAAIAKTYARQAFATAA
ncbi:thioredoxin family protein [Synechococcus sp. PCC 7336]|uniref:thioredoxin family protein n=1 Tax=Synechococcus sp. PCC 7336 TaxID=195250 RepID=UPI00034D8EFF|nr:thioredoxin family protein [Synechococcus sp. PCC 7336]